MIVWSIYQVDIEDKRLLKVFNIMRELYEIEPTITNKRYSIRSPIRVEREIDNLREEIYTLSLKI